jgi:hypothetical protein
MSLNSKTAEFQKKDVAYLFFITHRRRLYQPSLLQVTTCPLFSMKQRKITKPYPYRAKQLIKVATESN